MSHHSAKAPNYKCFHYLYIPGVNGKNIFQWHLDLLEYSHEYQRPKRSLKSLGWAFFWKWISSELAGCLECQSRRGGQRAASCQRWCLGGRRASPSSLRFSLRWEWHSNSCCINNVWEKRRQRCCFCRSRHLTLTHLGGLRPFNSTRLQEPSGVHSRDDHKVLLTGMLPYPFSFCLFNQRNQSDYRTGFWKIKT